MTVAGKTLELVSRDSAETAPQALRTNDAAISVRTFRLGLSAAGGIALLVGFITLGREPLWHDELVTLEFARQSVGEWVSQIPDRQNGLLYDLVLWPIVQLGGESAVWLRLPALLAVAGASVICGYVGARLGSRLGALVAAFLLALHPFAVYYGQEARPYGFVLFFSVLSALMLLRALERPTVGRWLAYALSMAALAYSHDFAVLIGIAHPVLVWAHRDKAVRKHFVAIVLAAAALVLPIVALVPENWATGFLGWVTEPALKDSIVLVGGGLREIFASALVLVASLTWLAVRRHAKGRPIVTSTAAFLALWLVAPVVLLSLLSLYEPVLVPRYVLASVPALCLALGLSLAALPTRLTILGAATLAAVFLAGSVQESVRLSKTDWPTAAKYLAHRVGPDEPIGMVGDGEAELGLLYYEPSTQSPAARVSLEERRQAFASAERMTVAELDGLAGRSQSFWLVRSGFLKAADEPLLARFLDRCAILEVREFRGGEIFHLTECP
jgi:mannosyltransferase